MLVLIMWGCCCGIAGRLGADIDIDAEYCGSSYGGGGRPSVAVGELLPRMIELRDGEKRPRPWLYDCWVALPDWNPYGVLPVLGGGHMPLPFGVNGGTTL